MISNPWIDGMNENESEEESEMIEVLDIDSSVMSEGRIKYIIAKLKKLHPDMLLNKLQYSLLLTRFSDEYSAKRMEEGKDALEKGELLSYSLIEKKEVDRMEFDWDALDASVEKREPFKMEVGEKVEATIENEGKFLSKKEQVAMGLKFPRDSVLIDLDVNGKKYTWWINAQNFSLLRQLKKIRDENGGKLKGVRISIERVSKEIDQKNYIISTVQ